MALQVAPLRLLLFGWILRDLEAKEEGVFLIGSTYLTLSAGEEYKEAFEKASL